MTMNDRQKMAYMYNVVLGVGVSNLYFRTTRTRSVVINAAACVSRILMRFAGSHGRKRLDFGWTGTTNRGPSVGTPREFNFPKTQKTFSELSISTVGTAAMRRTRYSIYPNQTFFFFFFNT